MSLFKRHIGRRVVGVGVGVALLMLGLAAPAFAAPTITTISPTSGPDECVVVITGTGFTEFPEAQTDVDFVTGATPTVVELDSAVISDTEIWATPVAAATVVPGTSYNVRIVTPGTGATGVTSTASFLATTGAGACGPTVTDFKPTCGSAGTVVTITGTNLLEKDLTGADVAFSPYAADATHTVPDVDTATSLSVIVPSGSGDGPIRVTTDVGQVFSSTSFKTPPPDCPTAVGHTRSITLSLRKHLVARGKVSSTEDPAFTDCVASVPVKIQRRRAGGGWRTVGSTTTTDTGAYKKRVKDRPGKYRALAPKVTVNDEDCLRDVSPVRRHTH
jgi:hypothetical protein